MKGMWNSLDLRGIVKVYPETLTRANDNVDLNLRRGEILCLAGENGAGKSTLMKVLYGLERPDDGTIFFDHTAHRIDSPLQANRLGVGMVHQHFMLIDEYSVAQNVTLGREKRFLGLFYSQRANEKVVERLLAKHKFSVTTSQRVGSLSVGQKQQVEILKMLYRQVELLILDEPTAVLTSQEVESLFTTLNTLRAQGKAIILITHKVPEIKRISDRVAIMRQGKMVGQWQTDSLSETEISALMMGPAKPIPFTKRKSEVSKRPVVRVEQLSVKRRTKVAPLLDNISFTAYGGEILGIAGVGGNGLSELEAVLSGTLKATSGHYFLGAREVTNFKPTQLRKLGLAYVPSNRLEVGSALAATVYENLIVTKRRGKRTWHHLHGEQRRKYLQQLLEKYQVQGERQAPLGTLSGGNIQKVILAREMELHADFILVCEPTWGLDLQATAFVHEQLLQMREAGVAVIVISSNLDEITELSDRMIVLCQRKVAAHLNQRDLQQMSKEELGAYMLGLRRQEEYGGQ